MKLYIAGPMTGLPDLNFPAFHAEAARLRAQAYEIVSPAELNPDHSMPWAECMLRDLEALTRCDGIVMLPGWEQSTGAQIERMWAMRLGLPVMDAV